MANDVFALSPISANGTLPSEADYNAISEAFMETARGRWFLKEYARRNRNADTAVVLEAVARIEASVAAQKRQGPLTGLAGAMATIQAIVDDAKVEASHAIEQLSQDQTFAPSRKAVRVIREVAWRLREIGYDGRICDILEAQADAIGANHDAPAMQEAHDAVLASFDLIVNQIGELADNGLGLTVVSTAPPPADLAEARLAREKSIVVDATQYEAGLSQTNPAQTLAQTVAENVVSLVSTPQSTPSATEADETPAALAAIHAVAASTDSPKTPTETEQRAPSLAEPSLGETLLARGMVTQPNAAKSNPLAPIHRMSQTEKIAFFS